MGRQAAVVFYVLALVAVVVGVDVLFFRNRFWERLMVNVGIVLVFCGVLLAVPEALRFTITPKGVATLLILQMAAKLLGTAIDHPWLKAEGSKRIELRTAALHSH